MDEFFRNAFPINYNQLSSMCFVSGILEDPCAEMFYFEENNKFNAAVKKELVEVTKSFVDYKFPKLLGGSDYLFSWGLGRKEDGVPVNDDPKRDSKRFFSIIEFFCGREKEK